MSKKYRSLNGHNYVSTVTGQETRVEPGGKITDMSKESAAFELKAGYIEEWVPRQTENVVNHDELKLDVDGVRSRRVDGELIVKEVN